MPDHLVELALDLFLEIRLDLIDVRELGERPAAVPAGMIHTGHPVGFHGGFLLFRVFAAIAFDLDDEVKEIVIAKPIIRRLKAEVRLF